MPGLNDAVEQGKQFWATRTTRPEEDIFWRARPPQWLMLALFVKLIATPDYKPLSDGSGRRGRAETDRAARCSGHSASDQHGWNIDQRSRG